MYRRRIVTIVLAASILISATAQINMNLGPNDGTAIPVNILLQGTEHSQWS